MQKYENYREALAKTLDSKSHHAGTWSNI